MRDMRIHLECWHLVPFFLCLILILCSAVPFHLFSHYPYRFNWSVIPIFYFAIYNPKSLSSWAVFLLGLVSDLLTTSPFGVVPFCYVLLFFIANFFRKYLIEFSFWPLWYVFAAIVFAIEWIEYFLYRLLSPYFMSFHALFLSFLVICLVYPFFIRVCAYVDKKIVEAA